VLFFLISSRSTRNHAFLALHFCIYGPKGVSATPKAINLKIGVDLTIIITEMQTAEQQADGEEAILVINSF